MTPDQIKMARHALGLPNGRKRSYRNRFYTGTSESNPSYIAWCDLVERGLAQGKRPLGSELTHFWLTERGAKMAIDPTESLDPEDFPSPQESSDV